MGQADGMVGLGRFELPTLTLVTALSFKATPGEADCHSSGATINLGRRNSGKSGLRPARSSSTRK